MSKKKKWLIVVAAILVVVAIGVGVGLGVGLSNRIKYKAHFFEDVFDWRETDIYEGVFELATSLEELKEICDTYENPAFSEDHYGYSTSICTKIREYNDAYFADKAVIIISGDGEVNRYKIKKIFVKNKELVVDISFKRHNGEFVMWIEHTTIIIEINKADISGITDIDII